MARKQRSVRLDTLARLATAPASTEAALAGRARALVALVRAGDDSPVSRMRLRKMLQQVAETEAGSARGLAAVFKAIDALEELDHPKPEQPDEPVEPDQFFELDLLWNMAAARGWSIERPEWRARTSRVRQLSRDGQRILATPDPPAALAEWIAALKPAARTR